MTHAQVRRRLSEYLEGELSAREEGALEAHLAECPPCALELRALQRSIEWLRALPTPDPPPDLSVAVIRRLRAQAEPAPRTGRVHWLGALRARSGLGWLAPVALAVGVGAIAWLGGPGARLDPADEEVAQALVESLLAGRTDARTARRLGGLKVVPAGVPQPSMQACVERSRRGERADECASWYAWFVAMALEDARGFAQEVAGLPAAARGPWLERVSEFAARSGSAPLVGTQLRQSHDPGAVRIAKRFERGSGTRVRTVGWQAAP
jgi:hypothetical protein